MKPLHQSPLNPRSDVLDVPAPTPESIAAAKLAQAQERQASGLLFDGDRIVSPGPDVDGLVERIAHRLAMGILQAGARLN